jgi:DNA polymerase (family 10)
MDKKEAAQILDQMGTLLELKGENPFRAKAYHNAALAVAACTEELSTLATEKRLHEIRGVGAGIAEVITDLIVTGKSKHFEELRSGFPAGVLELLRIQGLGPKRVKILIEKLKIRSIPELQKACEEHKLAEIDGFGKKTEENILKGIAQIQQSSDKHLYPKAKETADRIVALLSSQKHLQRCEIAGSLRRKKELIGDIDILASCGEDKRKAVFEAFTTRSEVDRVIAVGDTKASIVLRNGINCDLRIVNEREFPFALNYFTGSKEHNVEIRTLARTFGWSLNEYGFSKIEEKKATTKHRPLPKCKEEADIYAALGLDYIPPELRENMGEVQEASRHKLPRLIEERDIRGTLHCHTTSSDGLNSLEEMSAAAMKKGWQYLGIADHSQAAAYAGGLSPEKARQQLKAIDDFNKRAKGFRVFKGTECDILPDGSMDFPNSLLASYDYVVASIHSKFKMTEFEATKRLVKALKNKYVTMLGHPTGRLLLEREGYPVDMREVITVAADNGKMIELNAHPMRLDLDWRFLRLAKEKGVLISINPDAHNIDGLDDMIYGIGIARKGWLESGDVINTRVTVKLEELLKHAQGKS